MTDQTPPNKNRSLGRLRPQTKTKDRSPGSTGKIYIKRELLLHLYKQLTQSDDDSDIVACIAGWVNEDAVGPYMTIELSAKFQWSNSGDGSFGDFL